MKTIVASSYEEFSNLAYNEVEKLILTKAQPLICIAGGDTPKGLYKAMVNSNTSFQNASFISLDEWIGLGIETKGSCIEILETNLYKPLSLPPKNIHFFDGKSNDIEQECIEMDEFISTRNGIDLIVLGIGMNGHIGFNEPSVDINNYSFIISLDEVTKNVSAKYFETQITVEYGITLGMKHIMEAKKVILLVNGVKKSDIVKSVVQGEISNKVPASLLRDHPNCILIVDEGAASKI